MYCEQCGTKIEPQSKFCANCGSEVLQAPDIQTPEQKTLSQVGENNTSEQVVWVINAQRKISFFKRTACYLVFMEDKVIVAHLSTELRKAECDKVSQEIKAKGSGFFKGSAAMMQYWSNYHKKYYSMTYRQIISEDPANFGIQYQDIKKVLFKCESLDMDADGRSYGSQGKLNIDLFDGKTIKFSHNLSHNNSVKNTLIKLFNGKLKYKK